MDSSNNTYIQKRMLESTMGKKIDITSDLIEKYKDKYPSLKNIDTSESCKGIAWVNNDKLVALINVKTDVTTSIQYMEIFEGYNKRRYSQILLDNAKKLGARYASIKRTDKRLLKIFERYGFEKYREDASIIYMGFYGGK